MRLSFIQFPSVIHGQFQSLDSWSRIRTWGPTGQRAWLQCELIAALTSFQPPACLWVKRWRHLIITCNECVVSGVCLKAPGASVQLKDLSHTCNVSLCSSAQCVSNFIYKPHHFKWQLFTAHVLWLLCSLRLSKTLRLCLYLSPFAKENSCGIIISASVDV